jgi:hypothetical protein
VTLDMSVRDWQSMRAGLGDDPILQRDGTLWQSILGRVRKISPASAPRLSNVTIDKRQRRLMTHDT